MPWALDRLLAWLGLSRPPVQQFAETSVLRLDDPSLGAGGPAPSAAPPAALSPTAIENFDHVPVDLVLANWEDQLLHTMAKRIEQGRYQVPQLPSSHLLVMNMAGNPGVDMRELVDKITRDPVLSTELLKMANSALYATQNPADSLQDAVLRIGLRGLRSVVFAASMRGVLFRSKDLSVFAEEVWRQAYSMGCIAKAIGPLAGIDAERAFAIGLLHDIGKVPLLFLLRELIPDGQRASLVLVGRAFRDLHEVAGARMAHEWRLADELTAVIGGHHQFTALGEHARCGALASLAHKLDLQQSLASEREFRALAHSREADQLGLSEEQRLLMLRVAQEAFEDANRAKLVGAASVESEDARAVAVGRAA